MPAPTPQRRILLCVAGLTPAIITETLYGLVVDRGESVDEIYVITTPAGLKAIEERLLESEYGKFHQFCRDYGIAPGAVRFGSDTVFLLRGADGDEPADDIRTGRDNELAADQICEIVRELTRDPGVHVHASLAGGRKTMSVYLTAAMQLFGRAGDQISHVLVSNELENDKTFYYFRPGESREGRIDLADIPFIRLRRFLSVLTEDETLSYGALVANAQHDLEHLESFRYLDLDVANRTISASGRSARLEPRLFFWYLLFAMVRREGRNGDGFVAFDEITDADLDRVHRVVAASHGETLSFGPLGQTDYAPEYDFLDQHREKFALSVKRERLAALRPLVTQIKAKIKREIKKEIGPIDTLFVASRKDSKATRYGLDIPPEFIRGID